MKFLQDRGTNWRYILILVILAGLVGGGSWWWLNQQQFSPPEFFEIKIPQNSFRDLIQEKIEQGKEFLLRMEHPAEHGFYKKYDAVNDYLPERLHTVYSASIIYTLLKVYDFDSDERILEKLEDWGNFLISMQNKKEKEYGAFHYSYYFEEERKEMKFVVGTSALSIFTLLDLYQRTGDAEYLKAAKFGGDWLLTMQGEDGIAKPYKSYRDGKWLYGKKESLLYNGQVLSALSRIYKITREPRYYDSAEKIAKHFIARVAEDGCYLGDDYRNRNPISSAWVIMSLLDFYKVNPDEIYKNIILGCGGGLLKRQLDDPADILYYGRWARAYSTSGNGWLAEVMTEIYKFCREQKENDCDKYKQGLVKVIRWLVQNTYSEENVSSLANPQRAIGGIFWDYDNKYVRTDSVCHALNAYVGIINDLEDGFPPSIPEK